MFLGDVSAQKKGLDINAAWVTLKKMNAESAHPAQRRVTFRELIDSFVFNSSSTISHKKKPIARLFDTGKATRKTDPFLIISMEVDFRATITLIYFYYRRSLHPRHAVIIANVASNASLSTKKV